MKILFLVDSIHSIAAGSERQIFKLVDGLVNHGHEVKIVLLRHTQFTAAANPFPCEMQCLNIASLARFSSIKKMFQLRKEIARDKTQVVHAYFPDACILAPAFLAGRSLKVITSRRDMGLIYLGKSPWIFRLLGRLTDKVISNSQAVAEHICKIEWLDKQKSEVVYNGIEEFERSPSGAAPKLFRQDDSIKIILVANIKPVKRILDAVIAVSVLTDQKKSVELALVGENQSKDYMDKISSYIKEKNLTEKINITGSISEPRRLLNQAHIGILVSESEGLSNTIMEYMQAGLPVVATKVGGNPELVAHSQNGLLVEKGEPEQIANAILLLAENPELRQEMGEQGRRRIADEFSMDAMLRKHEHIYGESK